MATKANFPVTAGSIVVPYGHVIGNEKWRGSELAQRLQGKVRVIFEDALGLVDFHLSNRTCILLISEADLVAGDEFKRRLVRFRNASSLRGIVIVEKTPISGQYYLGVQKLVVLELGMVLLPVANQGEASQLIIQLVREQSRDGGANPFLGKRRAQLAGAAVLQAVQHIPGVGKAKALLLLQRFGSVHRLCNAAIHELEQALGQAVAQQIYTFLHS
ncbi:Fanconi anemia core complex-associated protein 24-like [Vidua chalybeata]|uniref:Fanconi anemia core complex-associated protein 24-like n=1 Tax=Vidua chalybeata TaxID=81927 RepID=UPI0023A80AC1|nr:Fanconi anemia core complex-associated protein 24-like [Vidua chalybeata]XP_053808934.1 Fanconi anemia core complex-associated protein 24-like [Vidua chalybeata]XP_053808935.1 Fanconi anemia core complex-associated protein 24-like [Vidua chalybeata]XP_053808936.1 Fanconi anemia core complex-associated protein 24-like [Vidua chalybeata]XP_053808938.1 Fanconi anemia core complex-associated protein 24-like [Vidua chalybeata]